MKYIISSITLIFAVLFLGYGYKLTHPQAKNFNSYSVMFQSIGHLKPGAPVDIAGVKVGYVQSVDLSMDTFNANVVFAVDKSWNLPDDSKIDIGAPALNASDAIVITPGTSKTYLLAGKSFSQVENPIGIEEQIGNFIFGGNLGN